MRLDYGKGVAQDRSGASKWYLIAAEGGMAEAQNSLGSLYEAGEGVAQDYSQALFWYQKAAEQVHPEALNNLGRLYDEGKGVVEDNSRAIDLYTKAAEHGFVSSMVNLSIMYRDGEGTATDLREAYKWIELSRVYTQLAKDRQLKWRIRGMQEALKARMTSTDLRVAMARARQWHEALK
jgi:TPR repeat protein